MVSGVSALRVKVSIRRYAQYPIRLSVSENQNISWFWHVIDIVFWFRVSHLDISNLNLVGVDTAEGTHIQRHYLLAFIVWVGDGGGHMDATVGTKVTNDPEIAVFLSFC
jgi:hypothetical protein